MELKVKIDDKDKAIIDLNTVVETNIKQMEYYEQEVREYRTVYEKTAKDLEQLTTKHTKLQDDYNHALFEKDRIKINLTEKSLECKVLRTAVNCYIIKKITFCRSSQMKRRSWNWRILSWWR